MTPDERAAILAAAERDAAADRPYPPLSRAQRDHLNAITRDARRTVAARLPRPLEGREDAETPR